MTGTDAVVILGAMPSRLAGRPDRGSAWPAWHHEAPSTVRLARMVGVDPDRLGEVFVLDNLCHRPDRTRRQLRSAGQGYDFSPRWAYVLVGTQVTQALGRRVFPAKDRLPWHTRRPVPLRWYLSAEGVWMSVLPHPSGRNRWYNDRRCVAAASRFLRRCVERGE